MSRAPVLIGVYTRLSHFRQAIEALQQNDLAEETDLFVASDYPRSDADAAAVRSVREYIDTISGFRSVTKIYRDSNVGTARNYNEATDQILAQYDRIIIMEDDILTGRGYLKFMNDGLDHYCNDRRVLAVCAYVWPGARFFGPSDTILLNAYNSWGAATWRDRWYSLERGPDLSKRFLSNWMLFWRMLLINPGLLMMVRASARGELFAGDVDWYLNAIKDEGLVLFPKISLVRNIGFDGTGLNCGFDSAFESQPFDQHSILTVANIGENEISANKNAVFKCIGGWGTLIRVVLLFATREILPDSIFHALRHAKRRLIALVRQA